MGLTANEVQAFEPHAKAAERQLPAPFASQVSEFFNDCETIVWAQSLTPAARQDYVVKAERAAMRVHHSALDIQSSLLALVRRATAA